MYIIIINNLYISGYCSVGYLSLCITSTCHAVVKLLMAQKQILKVKFHELLYKGITNYRSLIIL